MATEPDFHGSHGKDGFSYGLSAENGGKVFLGAHDVANGEQKGTSDSSSRVAFCIVFKLEPAGVEKNHGEASPSARVAVVLAGCHVNGQASSGTVILRTISLWRARGLSASR